MQLSEPYYHRNVIVLRHYVNIIKSSFHSKRFALLFEVVFNIHEVFSMLMPKTLYLNVDRHFLHKITWLLQGF